MLTLSGRLAAVDPVLSSTLSGNGRVWHDAGTPNISYQAATTLGVAKLLSLDVAPASEEPPPEPE